MSEKSLPIAYNLLRDTPHYRHDAFTQGLKACGFRVERFMSGRPSKNDVLVIWNRYNQNDVYARQFEAVGATVLVIENGYYDIGQKTYAISRNQHHHPVLDGNAVTLNEPYRRGNHILICAQRGIGSDTMRSPDGWVQKMLSSIQTKREIRVRYHPGQNKPETSLSDDLMNAHACVIWSSSCGIEALKQRVPVIYDAPTWVGKESSIKWTENLDIENLPHLAQCHGINRAVANQFTIDEIVSGEPLKRILWPNI